MDVLLTAADRVTLDGHVVNKVGTLAAALAADHFGVPYYAMVDHPDRHAPTIGDVRIEERDGDEVLVFAGQRITAEGVVGRYPAFDGLNLTWEMLEGLVKHNGPLTLRDGTPIGPHRERGLPHAIRSDNGTPFASANALFNLSKLAVWWLRLGIRLERIAPGHPEQNGRHERLHLTLKTEATRPAAPNVLQQ